MDCVQTAVTSSETWPNQADGTAVIDNDPCVHEVLMLGVTPEHTVEGWACDKCGVKVSRSELSNYAFVIAAVKI